MVSLVCVLRSSWLYKVGCLTPHFDLSSAQSLDLVLPALPSHNHPLSSTPLPSSGTSRLSYFTKLIISQRHDLYTTLSCLLEIWAVVPCALMQYSTRLSTRSGFTKKVWSTNGPRSRSDLWTGSRKLSRACPLKAQVTWLGMPEQGRQQERTGKLS